MKKPGVALREYHPVSSQCAPLIVDCALLSGTASSPSALRQSLTALRGLHPLMAFLLHLQLSQETC